MVQSADMDWDDDRVCHKDGGGEVGEEGDCGALRWKEGGCLVIRNKLFCVWL